jgi:hypothetical protein
MKYYNEEIESKEELKHIEDGKQLTIIGVKFFIFGLIVLFVGYIFYSPIIFTVGLGAGCIVGLIIVLLGVLEMMLGAIGYIAVTTPL